MRPHSLKAEPLSGLRSVARRIGALRSPAYGFRAAVGTSALLAGFVLAGLFCTVTAAADEALVPWATRRAAELTATGERLAAAGSSDDALVAFRDAIAMDPTYGRAFLDLAAAREAAGDVAEAERVLSMALERIPEFPEARARRAKLREWRGDGSGASDDLELALDDRPTDLALHGRLVDACIRAGALPRALAAARRWGAAALAAGDDATHRRATQTAAALSMVVDDADPVTTHEGRGEVRGLLRAWARRLHQTSTAKSRAGR